MRKSASIIAAFGLVAVGYLLGSTNILTPGHLLAQDEAASQLSDDSRDKIAAARRALEAAEESMITDGVHKPITRGVNPIAILAGGLDTKRDLEAGLGVDPGTFAALYADLAIDEVAEKLGRDAEGRLTYNKRVIQMYPISSIKKLYRSAEVVPTEEDE